MDKKQLLQALYEAEQKRLRGLSRYKLVGEFQEWFQEDIKKGEPSETIIASMLNDFMQYREAENLHDLKAYYSNYK